LVSPGDVSGRRTLLAFVLPAAIASYFGSRAVAIRLFHGAAFALCALRDLQLLGRSRWK
jgi:hypothetical protein